MQEDRYNVDRERAFGSNTVPTADFLKGKKDAINVASALVSLQQHFGWKIVLDHLMERKSMEHFVNIPPDKLVDFQARVKEIDDLLMWITSKIREGGLSASVLTRINEED